MMGIYEAHPNVIYNISFEKMFYREIIIILVRENFFFFFEKQETQTDKLPNFISLAGNSWFYGVIENLYAR